MSKLSLSGNAGNSVGRDDSWMVLAVARSCSLRLATSSIMSPRAFTVVLMPSASEANSHVDCSGTRSPRLPAVIFASDRLVSSIRRTIKRRTKTDARTAIATTRTSASAVAEAIVPARLAKMMSDVR